MRHDNVMTTNMTGIEVPSKEMFQKKNGRNVASLRCGRLHLNKQQTKNEP